jgi:hypothetical protein
MTAGLVNMTNKRQFANITAECKYELVQVVYDIKWINSVAFEFEKNNPLKSIQVHQKKTWYVRCNKIFTALHFG